MLRKDQQQALVSMAHESRAELEQASADEAVGTRKQALITLAGGFGALADTTLASMRYEHLRVLLEEDQDWASFCELAPDFARATVPEDIMQALRLRRMAALQKKNGNVRSIVASSVFRRLV